MDVSQLRAIIALGELGSISRVAEALHLTPPAVFSQIRNLESEVGAKLYERVGNRLELTGHGKRLAERARDIVRAHDATLAELRELGVAAGALLRIGCGPHSSVHILPPLVERFLRLNPAVELRLATGGDDFLLHGVRTGLLDAILIHLPLDKVDLEEHPLFAYEMVFVLPAGRGGGRSPITPAQLAGMPYVRWRRPVLVDAVLEKLSCEAGFQPRTVIEHDNPAAVIEFVKRNLGFAILPYYTVARDHRARRVRIIRPRTRSSHLVGLAYRRTGYRPRILRDLIAVANEWREWWPLAPYVIPASGGKPAPHD
jgi:DNA-binding transcriptional LysR family regulator